MNFLPLLTDFLSKHNEVILSDYDLAHSVVLLANGLGMKMVGTVAVVQRPDAFKVRVEVSRYLELLKGLPMRDRTAGKLHDLYTLVEASL